MHSTAKTITLLNRFHNTKSWFIFHVAGYLLTWILADTIWVPCLRMTLGTQCQQGQKWLKKLRPSKTILFRRGMYLSSPYKGVPSPPPANQANHQFQKTLIYRNCDAFLSFNSSSHNSQYNLISILFFVKVFLVNKKMLPNWKCKMIVTNLHKSQICIENFDGDCKEQAPNEYLPQCL